MPKKRLPGIRLGQARTGLDRQRCIEDLSAGCADFDHLAQVLPCKMPEPAVQFTRGCLDKVTTVAWHPAARTNF